MMQWHKEILVKQKQTIKEYDIIKAWQDKNWLTANCLATQLGLFRVHFGLFHQLHTLNMELGHQNHGRLLIHSLKIQHVPSTISKQCFNAGGQSLELSDPLILYYLNSHHFFHTDEAQIIDLMKLANSGMAQPEKLRHALARFQLSLPINQQAVKKAYRRLAMNHHPDRGGELDTIKTINEDKALLLKWLQYQ